MPTHEHYTYRLTPTPRAECETCVEHLRSGQRRKLVVTVDSAFDAHRQSQRVAEADAVTDDQGFVDSVTADWDGD